MEHRDAVIPQKVLSEINIAQDMVGDKSLAEFISSEMLKRACVYDRYQYWRTGKKSLR